jgi:hypothetical protein
MAKIKGEFLGDIFQVDSASGNGSTTIFSLSQKLRAQEMLFVFIDGLKKRITTDYTVNVSTSQVTFVTAPATAQNIEFHYIKKSL